MSYTTRRALEYDYLATAGTNLKAALLSKGNPSGIDDTTGLVGANQTAWYDASLQSDALWTIQTAIAYANASAVLESKNAFAAAFAHYNANGWIENGYGYTASQAIETNSFFLAEFMQFRELISQTGVWGTYQSTVEGWDTKVDGLTRWLASHYRRIGEAAVIATNRRLRGAMGLLFGGRLVHNRTARLRGRRLFVGALNRQHEDGWFYEKGGYDSGYQAFSIMSLCAMHCYALEETIAATAKAVATTAVTWLVSRIDADTGEVDDTGNTRTLDKVEYAAYVADPEGWTAPDGYLESPPKSINYAEVVKALHDCTAIGIGDYAALGDKVYDYAVA